MVRAHDQLGDFLLATPALAALRRRFAGASLTLVVNRFLSPLALHQPDVDRVVVAPWIRSPRHPGQIARLLRDLGGRKYDLALVLNTVSHSLTSDLVARLSRAGRVAGPARPELKDVPGAPLYDWVYEPAIPRSRHQMARALAAVEPLGCDPAPLAYRMGLDPPALDAAIRACRSLPSGPRVAVHVGTRDPEKRYPTSSWIAALERVGAESGAHVVLLDAPDARAEVRQLSHELTVPHTALGPRSLAETAALVSLMPLLLCHDSALLHVAAAVETPTVCVHGRGEVAEWAPPGELHRALQASDRRPADIAPQVVAEEALALLSRVPAPAGRA